MTQHVIFSFIYGSFIMDNVNYSRPIDRLLDLLNELLTVGYYYGVF